MTCTEIQAYLQEHFVADGMEISPDLRRHLDECPECRAAYDELTALADMLAPLERIEMTAEESTAMLTALDRQLASSPRPETISAGESRVMTIVRTSLAAAAVVVMILASASFNKQFPSSPALFEAADDAMLSQVTSDDMVTLIDSTETGWWTNAIDDNSAMYLTEVASVPQMESVLTDLSTEELEWLAENYSMEM